MWVTSFGNGLKVANLTAGIENVNAEKAVAMDVYPNPGDDIVYIELPAGDVKGHIEVYDASGRLIQRRLPAENGINSLHVKDWVPGIYFINYGRAHAKFVKE
jgi:hypothetical protein